MTTLTAVLFAGGESRRMGADKATLLVAGEFLWSRQLRILREMKPARILISARTRPAWCPAEIETVLDEPPTRGPLSGLLAALKKNESSHLLALAVDLPRMTSRHLQKICKQAVENYGVVPALSGELDPLCAIYPGGNASKLAAGAALAGGDFSVRNFAANLVRQKCLRVFAVSESDRENYLNANTPADLAGAALPDIAKTHVP